MKLFSMWLLVIPAALYIYSSSGDDWRTASREPAGIAPDPATTQEAVLQVYAAPAYGWRGWFAVHTWISVKPTAASNYTVYEVIGWRLRRGVPALRIAQDYPDRYWFGKRPRLLLDRRGDGIDDLISRVHEAALRYPWADQYRVWPGPNSNTFPAWIASQVPELGLELPATAIGKNWID